MKIIELVEYQFRSGKPVTLSEIYDAVIYEVKQERGENINTSSLKHTIRGIIRNLNNRNKIKKVRSATYQKM